MKPRSGTTIPSSTSAISLHTNSSHSQDNNTMPLYDDDDNKVAKHESQQSQRLIKVFVVAVMLVALAVFAIIVDDESNTLDQERQWKQQQLHLGYEGGSGSSGSAVDEQKQVQGEVGVGYISDRPTEEQLQKIVDDLDAKVRQRKSTPDVIMETDTEGLKLTKELQHATHSLILKRYGGHTKFRVKVDLLFPEIITSNDGLPTNDYILIEMAPIDLIPCSVYNFLEIARTWKHGSFHRNANHVLQVQSYSNVKKSMPFQEYSQEYPHAKGTTGYAGRPSGPGWYVSILDNTRNHGPGSQQTKNPYEADSLFGRVVKGFEGQNSNKSNTVMRIHSTPQNGWLNKENQIMIPKMTILITNDNGITWIPWTSTS